MATTNLLLPDEVIYRKIFVIRDQKVMLDSDLAELYQVDTRRLNEQVKRNPNRFPEDFMFQLTQQEWDDLMSQFATSSSKARHGGRRKLPYVFTEHGVLMLSSVLGSDRAVAVNIRIMRIYTRVRELLGTDKELLARMRELETTVGQHDEKFNRIFLYLDRLLERDAEQEQRPEIGYRSP